MKKPKRPLMSLRIEAFAAQAFLLVSFADQGDDESVGAVLVEMSEVLEEDKKLAQHLFPGLQKLCRDKGLEIHGHHVVKTEKH